jgi:peptidoglycan/LPS O-acetylase OafA/YrhL
MNHKEKSNSNYKTFGLMMLTSFVMMYGIMFLNIFEIDHLYLSTTRTYMTLLMVSPMAISMLLFMWRMYGNKRVNFTILGVSVLVFCFSLFGLRTQTPIGDVAWMKAMIPHHSSAILTSSNANFKDPEVKKLAQEIIKAQEKEIAEMKAMIERLKKE